MKSWIIKIAVCIIIFYILACNPFGPAEGEGEGNNILTDQRTPQEVFTNFSYAYNFKDSIVYSDLLDSSFLFISTNYATTPVSEITWGRDIDIKTTVGMFRHFRTLNLLWIADISYGYENDSTEYEVEKTFQLTLDGGQEFPALNGRGKFRLHKRIINPKDSCGVWLLTRWEDQATF